MAERETCPDCGCVRGDKERDYQCIGQGRSMCPRRTITCLRQRIADLERELQAVRAELSEAGRECYLCGGVNSQFCSACGGRAGDAERECERCKGAGRVLVDYPITHHRDCPDCTGRAGAKGDG